MNLQEFKAWFDGFTEAMSDTPTKKQWARIRERMAEIKDAPPVSYPVYIDRYWRYSAPWYTYTPTFVGSYGGCVTQTVSSSQPVSNTYQLAMNSFQPLAGNQPDGQMSYVVDFSSIDGFKALGRADAETVQ